MTRSASPLTAEYLASQLTRLRSSGKVVVALSGGADSAALLAAAAALRPRYTVRALHVDHGLAGSAVLRRAALSAAEYFGISCTVAAVTLVRVKEAGLEAAARAARYECFAAHLGPAEELLTAHHCEDQAETLLLQLMRGAGARGLAAMPEAAVLGRGRLLRPLLQQSRAMLREFAVQSQVPWIDDPSNNDLEIDRNFLRARIWPLLSERWPAVAKTLSRTARTMAETVQVLDDELGPALAALTHGRQLDLAALASQPSARRRELLRSWLRACGLRAPSERQMREIERQFLQGRADRHPQLPVDGMELHRHDGKLWLLPPLPQLRLGADAWLPVEGDVCLPGLGVLQVSGSVSGHLRELAPARYRLTPRLGGERWSSEPNRPSRALKDELREARVPPWVRDRTLLLWDGQSLAAVVMPGTVWVAPAYRPTDGQRALWVSWSDAPEALQAQSN